MAEHEQFGEVRSLLSEAPSASRWWALCALLERVGPDRYEAELSHYVTRGLQRWPDALRIAPLRWLRAGAQGEPVPWLGLAHNLWITAGTLDALATPQGTADERWADGAARLVALEPLRALRQLHVEVDYRLSAHGQGLWRALDQAPWARVRRVQIEPCEQQGMHQLSRDEPPALGDWLWRGPIGASLEALVLRRVMDPSEVVDWLEHPRLRALRELEVSFDVWGGEALQAQLLEAILQGEHGALERLALTWGSRVNATLPSARADALPALRELSLSSSYGVTWPQGWEGLVASAPSLQALRLVQLPLDEEGGQMRDLLSALEPVQQGLTSLSMRISHDRARGRHHDALTRLAAWVAKSELVSAQLEHIALTDEAGQALASALCARPSLRALSLSSNDLTLKTTGWLDSLSRAPLEVLSLEGPKLAIGEEGARAVSALGSLRALTMTRVGMRERGAALWEGALGQQLKWLDLTGAQAGSACVHALIEANPQALEGLILATYQTHNGLDDDALIALSQWPGLSRLRALSLGCARAPAAGLAALLRSPHLTQLEVLDLTLNALPGEPLQALCESSHLSSVRALGLADCSLDDDALGALIDCGVWRALRVLAMAGNKPLKRAGWRRLLAARDALPMLEQVDGGSQLRDLIAQDKRAMAWFATYPLGYRGLSEPHATHEALVPCFDAWRRDASPRAASNAQHTPGAGDEVCDGAS